MKTTLFVAIIATCLVGSALSLSCNKGYYDPGSSSPTCTQCYLSYTQCNYDGTNMFGTVHSRLKGWYTHSTTGTANAVCNGYYNKEKDTCDSLCKDGCYGCAIDYDFCTSCHSGYAWNPDYTCLPSIIGLEAASLALLVLALVFLVIGCCYVNKARK